MYQVGVEEENVRFYCMFLDFVWWVIVSGCLFYGSYIVSGVIFYKCVVSMVFL